MLAWGGFSGDILRRLNEKRFLLHLTHMTRNEIPALHPKTAHFLLRVGEIA